MDNFNILNVNVGWRGDSVKYGQNFFRSGIRREYIIHYVTQGSGWLTMAGRTHKIVCGDSFIIFPDMLVEYHPDENDPWEYKWVNFFGLPIKDYLLNMDISPKNPVFRKTNESPEIFLDNMIELPIHRDTSAKFEALANLFSLFSFYTKHYPAKSTIQDTGLLNNILEFIDNNLNNSNFNISFIAKNFNITRSTLFRIFKKNYNISPIDFLNNHKINKTKELLKNTDIPIKSVAFSLGFTDALYFSRFFKKYVGCSPSDFRKNNTK